MHVWSPRHPPNPRTGCVSSSGRGASGVFAEQEGAIASFDAGTWRFITPQAGFLAYDAGDAALLVHDGAALA